MTIGEFTKFTPVYRKWLTQLDNESSSCLTSSNNNINSHIKHTNPWGYIIQKEIYCSDSRE